MKTLELLERPTDPFEVAIGPDESGYTLNIAGVYQDSVTRNWAIQSYLRATRMAGEEHVQNKWYDVNALGDPMVLAQAVGAARVADVIVVSVYAADELPLNLYAWVAAWLPRRLSRTGALAALVGVAEPLDPQSVRTIEYLQAVARKAQLDFVPQARQRAFASPRAVDPIMEPPSTGAPSFTEPRSQSYFNWGIND